MVGPEGISAYRLARELNVASSTLSKWKREAMLRGVSPRQDDKVARRGHWTPSEKLRVIEAAAKVGEAGLGELLRSEGLHEADLHRFRQELVSSADQQQGRGANREAKRVRQLEKELRRKDKALAETAALLVLRKKAEAFFSGEEEGDTDERKDS